MKDKSVAVVVAVYNGAEYLKNQLDTIRTQTLPPDRVLLGDDCSADSSLMLIDEYIRQFHLDNWTVIRREKNIGWRANFIDLLQHCQEDYVFLCDQDDIWYEQKLEKMLDAMTRTPQALCMASDPDIKYIDDVRNIVRLQIREKDCPTGNIEHVAFDREFDVVKRPGCTYCLTQELVEMMLKAWKPDYAHDALAWALSNTMGKLYILHEKTMVFQRHGSSVTSVQPRKTRTQMIAYLQERLDYDQSLIDAGEAYGAPSDHIAYLGKHRKFIQERETVFVRGSMWRLVLFQMKWHGYYPKRRSLLADYYYLFHRS